MSRLGITRSLESLNGLRQKADASGVEIVSLPIIETVAVEFKLERNNYDWIFFTSANGVKHFFSQIESIEFENVKFAAVGVKTEKELLKYGIAVSFVPPEAYGKTLFEEFVGKYNGKQFSILFPRAEIVNYDPESLLKDTGFKYYPVVCYKTIEKDIDSETVSRLGQDDSILFTSPSTVRFYNDKFGVPKAKKIAIGDSTASQMNQLNWDNVITMDNPDIDTILEYI